MQGKFGFSISSETTDTFMCISDYNNLRDMLGLSSVVLDLSLIHICTRSAKSVFADLRKDYNL